jgi:uncharacterized protein with von Willebrand factor type A (vWA) domain
MSALCDRCLACESADDKTLYDLAHMDDKSMSSLVNECKYNMKDLQEKALDCAQRRMEENRAGLEEKKEKLREMKEGFARRLLEQLEGGKDLDGMMQEYLSDESRRALEEELSMMSGLEDGIQSEDIKNGLQEYVEKNLIEIEGDGIRITPKGCDRLAKYVLKRIWDNLSGIHSGTNPTKEEGFGVSHGFSNRKYEYGDEFDRIDMESTLLTAMERHSCGRDRIEFAEEDIWVKETHVDTKLCVGLIVDESGSMSGDKIHAAMDISAALSELMSRSSRDKLRLLLFSNQVREVPYWDMMNVNFAGGTTDIKSALKRFRMLTAHETADKQVYLITDTEPNSEDGRYVGFEKAALGVINEAQAYQREGITLNIIMLDNTPHLKEFATLLARRNLGRVFFAEPKELGRVIVEDYLRSKKKQKLKRVR